MKTPINKRSRRSNSTAPPDAPHGAGRRPGVPGAGRARGAVLFVGLIILAIMTITGLAAMRGSTLEERMAGNLKDHSAALQAAEAALQAALTKIEDQTGPLTGSGIAQACRVSDADGATLCKRDSEFGSDWLGADAPSSGAKFSDFAKGGFGPTTTKDGKTTSDWEQPRISVHYRHSAPMDFEAVVEGRGLYFYTVSAVASGRSGTSRIVLQTTIPKVYAW